MTGPDMGLLEVVQNAETTGAINREAGGARQVLKESTLYDWLRKECNNDEKVLKAAQRKFAMSCAGYCGAPLSETPPLALTYFVCF